MTKKKRWSRTTRAGKPNWRQNFLDALKVIPNVTYACAQAKISRNQAYGVRKENPKFAEAWDQALTAGVEGLEQSMWTRATFGLKKNVWMKDEGGKPIVVDTETIFDTTAAIFLLKAHKPEKYRERMLISSPPGESLNIGMDPEVVSALQRIYGQDAAKDSPKAE